MSAEAQRRLLVHTSISLDGFVPAAAASAIGSRAGSQAAMGLPVQASMATSFGERGIVGRGAVLLDANAEASTDLR